MPYEVPPLPYDYNALEPHIDEQTMQLHHDKHHQAYVDKATAALEGTDFDGKPVEEVLKSLDSLPADKRNVVRNNGGGHYNHSLFWESMSPDGGLLVAECRQVLQDLVDVLVRPLGALEGGVGLVHVSLVVLVVMDAHRLLVDVRLERVVVVRQRWNFVGHSTAPS